MPENAAVDNPYAAPSADCSVPISLSAIVSEMHFAIGILVLIQLALGLATAAVVSQEDRSPDSFLIGVALMTMVVAALAGYIGGLRVCGKPRLTCWAVAVTVIAWGCFLLGLWSAGRALSPPAGISPDDLPRFALMAGMTFVFVMLFLARFLPDRSSMQISSPNA